MSIARAKSTVTPSALGTPGGTTSGFCTHITSMAIEIRELPRFSGRWTSGRP
jgi:hypothetical protein